MSSRVLKTALFESFIVPLVLKNMYFIIKAASVCSKDASKVFVLHPVKVKELEGDYGKRMTVDTILAIPKLYHISC